MEETELIACISCGAPLDINNEFSTCKYCRQTNLLGERAIRALRYRKIPNISDYNHAFLGPSSFAVSTGSYSSSAISYNQYSSSTPDSYRRV